MGIPHGLESPFIPTTIRTTEFCAFTCGKVFIQIIRQVGIGINLPTHFPFQTRQITVYFYPLSSYEIGPIAYSYLLAYL